ncbi:nuclear receptor subfamily 1 group D member 1-like [Babylonia areolata]|uniref:nuclear receptor subfamily 1 group D member 1-like n=1 Tax=Babylonia areolata TaxID=304850 RepID=UPI003FD6A353
MSFFSLPQPELSRLTLDPNDIWQRFISATVPEITRVVKFCKKLPGFVEIEQDDQIVLIKQGAFEVMMARFSLLVDHDRQTMMDPCLSTRSPRMRRRACLLGAMCSVGLVSESGVWACEVYISRKGLKNQRAISKIQSLFQQALYFLMKHNHSDPDQKFTQLMSLITTFHRINEEHFKALNNIRMNTNSDLSNQFPELHREIFSTQDFDDND